MSDRLLSKILNEQKKQTKLLKEIRGLLEQQNKPVDVDVFLEKTEEKILELSAGSIDNWH